LGAEAIYRLYDTERLRPAQKIFISQWKLNVRAQQETVQTLHRSRRRSGAQCWNADFGFYFWIDGGRGEYREASEHRFNGSPFQLPASVLTEKLDERVRKKVANEAEPNCPGSFVEEEIFSKSS